MVGKCPNEMALLRNRLEKLKQASGRKIGTLVTKEVAFCWVFKKNFPFSKKLSITYLTKTRLKILFGFLIFLSSGDLFES